MPGDASLARLIKDHGDKWVIENDCSFRGLVTASKPRSARAEQARLSAAMRAGGCSWRQVAGEFVRRWRVTYLQAFRLAHGLSQEQAAARYNSRWQPDRPLTGKYLSYWEAWPSITGKEPSLGKLGMLAAVYECSVSDLLADVGDHRSLDSVPARAPVLACGEQSGLAGSP